MSLPPTIDWIGDQNGHCEIIDQTVLPLELKILRIDSMEGMRDAIQRLAVRGAPAIGVAGGFGVVLGLRGLAEGNERQFFEEDLPRVVERVANARPTAVNLSWAVDRLRRRALELRGRGVGAIKTALFEEARRVLEEDRSICRRLGEIGSPLINDGARVLTHCNAGALATAAHGTALSLLFEAQRQQKRIAVYADETRPLLQGARLTAWELQQAGIDVTLICDNMAAHVMQRRLVDLVVVGADRIARNGDTANKIGTYGVALLARAHNLPFYVVAPKSTFDLSISDGSKIPIEERPAEEVTEGFGRRTAPLGVKVFSPAFDVTPSHLITAIVTEFGIIQPVNEETIRRTFNSA